MVSNNFKINFNFITNLILLFILIFGGFVWADSNGVWHEAKDVKPGTFGSDEQDVSASGYRFLNPLRVDSDFTLSSIISCNGKLGTDSSGKVICSVDNVNDADADPNNEKPIAGIGITMAADTRTVNVDTNTIATKTYVNSQISANTPPSIKSCYFSRSYATRNSINQQIYGGYPGACRDIGNGYIFTGTYMVGQYGDSSAGICSKIVFDGSSSSFEQLCPGAY